MNVKNLDSWKRSAWIQGVRASYVSILIQCIVPFTAFADSQIEQSITKPDRLKLEAGAALGAGIGLDSFGSKESHDLALSNLHFGWTLNQTYFKSHWYKGQIGLYGEFMAGSQLQPDSGYMFGLSPTVRYRFTYWDRLQPFVIGAAGLMTTDIGSPDLGGKLQFYQQVGMGLLWHYNDYFALNAQVRYAHISNAGIRKPNRGVNNLLVFIGGNWSF